MIEITKLTDSSKQKLQVIGEDGEQVLLRLTYSSTQEAWNINIEYLEKFINGLQLTVSPNILHNYKNVIPFGISCTSTDGFEPKYIEDFANGRIKLFMTSIEERDNLEEAFFK